MATIASEETACGKVEDGLTEWRSSEQVENGAVSISPSYQDSFDTDDDEEPKPSDLYGKYIWKIENFSQISGRELRSNAFEIGGIKWHLLIYFKSCFTGAEFCFKDSDMNHLSLFLCLADHDKLHPAEWSHFAQFTIGVENKDPKRTKYSDTFHRFWKKEHDWGWKKFMELSKLSDGFVEDDTLIINAQVQVIRVKEDRPFRCLSYPYKRELLKVYLTYIENICQRFVNVVQGKLGKLIEDEAKWSSFHAFWVGVDQNAKHEMSRERKDTILKVVVKGFFLEKEVTSCVLMDYLCSGLKALESHGKSINGKALLLESEEILPPIIGVQNDMFVLVNDVLLLLQRAAVEPFLPKDDQGPQNRIEVVGSEEDFDRESIERHEKRLTLLGRRTIEFFVLDHIFSNIIEVAYQKAVEEDNESKKNQSGTCYSRL